MSVTAGTVEPDRDIVESLDTDGVEDADSMCITVVVALSVTDGVELAEITCITVCWELSDTVGVEEANNGIVESLDTDGVEDAEIVSVP